jgi:hypothetical protein
MVADRLPSASPLRMAYDLTTSSDRTGIEMDAVLRLPEDRMAEPASKDARTQGAADPYPNDPFFKRKLRSIWNACIGDQGDEENYLDGYIEAAMELAGPVIDKKMIEKRDTLYNARHAVELALKFATDRLAGAGLTSSVGRRSHNIKAHPAVEIIIEPR